MINPLLAIILMFGLPLVLARADSPTIVAEMTLLPVSVVLNQDRIALLGDHAVVTKAVAQTYMSPQRPFGEQLLVVENPINGRFGTTDGGIVVRLHSAGSLDGLAADYGLTVKHVFTAQPVGVVAPEVRETADAYVTRLRDDYRVVSAELNVNFYQEQEH
jgi:hypothetical protein